MNFFKEQVLNIDEKERSFLANILIEARELFVTPLDNPYTEQMEKKQVIPIGTEQLIRMNLEQFLLHLLRRCLTTNKPTNLPATKNITDIFKRVTDYMDANLSNRLTIKEICRDNMIGRTQLQNVFQKETNMGVIEYFSKMKIDAAKHLIRDGLLNFTQISEHLGYTSIHYFSRQFKQITGMTPSNYASSVKAIMEKNE